MQRHNLKTRLGVPGMLPGQIGQTLRNLTNWAVAASLGASGCEQMGQPVPPGGQAGGTAPAPGAWEAFAPNCETLGQPNVLAGELKLTREPDSLQLYLSYPRGIAQSGAYPAGASLFGSTGMPCASAADREACELERMERSLPSAACRNVGASDCRPFALTTQGSEVTRLDKQADLLDLLGNIDTPAEAVALAIWNGLTVTCAAPVWRKELRGTEVMSTAAGYTVRSEWELCGGKPQRDTIDVARNGSVGELMSEALGDASCSVGRRPAGLVAALPCAVQSRLGAFFADIARLEAASVFAFQRMARELTQLGAPPELVADALSAARDEIRHEQLTAALALRFGARPVAPVIASPGPRSRFEIALENAVEGCVRETYGALVAHHQARLARDREVAAVMSMIAPDETRHAELAWRVAAWLEPQLTGTERGLLAQARRVAAIQLAREASTSGLAEQDARTVGCPSGHVSSQLVGRMAGDLGVA